MNKNFIGNYLSKMPQKENLIKALIVEVKQFCFSLKFIFNFYKNGLQSPEKPIPWDKNNWSSSDLDLNLAKEIFVNSEDRFSRLEDKSNKMFGVSTFFIPLVLGVFTYVIEHTVVLFVFVLLILSLLFYFLSLWASIRATRIKERQSPGLSLLISSDNDAMESPKKEKIVACYLHCAQHNETVNDHIANFIRSAESFIFIAIFLTILTGSFALYYKIKQPPSKDAQVSVLMQSISESKEAFIEILNQMRIEHQSESTVAELKERIQKMELLLKQKNNSTDVKKDK